MPNSFSLTPSQCTPVTAPSLRAEIVSRTGSEAAANSILRSLDRFGTDASIDGYEIVPKVPRSGGRNAKDVIWTVRAMR